MSTADASALTVESTRTYRREVEAAVSFLQQTTASLPSLGLVLTSEIGGIEETFSCSDRWSIGEIPHFPKTGESASTLLVGRVGSTPVFLFDGALSLDAGYSPREVVFPVRMLAEAGVDTMVFVNTVGSLRPEIVPSDLVLATDHINFQGANPLVGPNVEEWGPRFPDMTEPYAPSLRHASEEAARKDGLSLRQGIYFAMLGPGLGTSAEHRMARTLGADIVGTSSVPEVIAARHMGVRVLMISVVTRQCTPTVRDRQGVDRTSSAVDDGHSELLALLDGTLDGVASEEKPV